MMDVKLFPWRPGMKWSAEIVAENWWGERPTVVSGRIKDGEAMPPETSRQQSGSDFGRPSYADLKLGNYTTSTTDWSTLGAFQGACCEHYGPDAHLVRFPTNDASGPVLWWALADGEGKPIQVKDVEGHVRYLAGPTRFAALMNAWEAVLCSV